MEHVFEQPRMWKAHGTGNHFILIDDPKNRFDLDPNTVSRLCHPHTGIGADGVIRVVEREGMWFMDYRNADGSLAEMCGNGVRVFVDHLRRRGFIQLNVGERITIDTRGGTKEVELIPAPQIGEERPSADELWYRVNMGPALLEGQGDMSVQVAGLSGTYSATRIAMPNPHAVIVLDSEETLRQAILPNVDVNEAPLLMRALYTPAPEAGVNLELIVREPDMPPSSTETETQLGEGVRGHLLMRVLERGVGETASCGTGCCAAAVAATISASEATESTSQPSTLTGEQNLSTPTSWIIDVPGGRVIVDCPNVVGRNDKGEVQLSSSAAVYLSGPATPVAEIIVSHV